MPAAQWLLHNDRPVIEIVLSGSVGQDLVRSVIADTGAGARREVFPLILDENDCLRYGGTLMGHVQLGGAYTGSFPVYAMNIRIPQLNFDEPVPVVGVSWIPPGFDGIAALKFLSRFHYGNFGHPDYFGLE